MRTRAERRKNDFNKANRKKNISETHYGFSYYDNTHQYSKNKIHCSCPLCSSKTSKYGNTLNYKHSDELKINSMNEKIKDFDT